MIADDRANGLIATKDRVNRIGQHERKIVGRVAQRSPVYWNGGTLSDNTRRERQHISDRNKISSTLRCSIVGQIIDRNGLAAGGGEIHVEFRFDGPARPPN